MAYRWFLNFCDQFKVLAPFPVSELLLCYLVAFLAQEGLAPSSIKLYLAAVQHKQVRLSLSPAPRSESSLPRLKLVLNGISRSRAMNGTSPMSNLVCRLQWMCLSEHTMCCHNSHHAMLLSFRGLHAHRLSSIFPDRETHCTLKVWVSAGEASQLG